MRIFRVFPSAEPELVYVGSTTSTSAIRKVLANFLHSVQRAAHRLRELPLLHEALKKHPLVSGWSVEEVFGQTLEQAIAATRALPGVQCLNEVEKPAGLAAKDAVFVVKITVRELPELFSLRISTSETPVEEMFQRFRQLNAMRATRGQILVDFPEGLVKAISKWYDEEMWTWSTLKVFPSMTEAQSALPELRTRHQPPLDRAAIDGPLGPESRANSLLRWLRDLRTPSLAHLNELDRTMGSPPPPVPLPGFITVLVTRPNGREKIVSLNSNDPHDLDHIYQVARASARNYPDSAVYIAPPIYCGDVNSAKIIASTTKFLAANWDKFRQTLTI